jgi:hypothetical protein
MSTASDWIEKFTAPGVSVEVAQVMIEDIKKEGKVAKLVNDWVTFPDGSLLNIKKDLWDSKNKKNNL